MAASQRRRDLGGERLRRGQHLAAGAVQSGLSAPARQTAHGSELPTAHRAAFWVVGDFSLVDAIESGLVKIPRVPVADDSATEVSGAARRDKTEKVRNSAGPVGAGRQRARRLSELALRRGGGPRRFLV